MHRKLPFSNPLDVQECEPLGSKRISDLLHPLVSYRVVLAVVLAGCAFGAQATVEKTDQNAEVQGRTDQYNWQWDDANTRWIVNVVPEAASSIRSREPSGGPLQSILRSYGFQDDFNVHLQTNNAASSVVYNSELYGEAVSTANGTEQGPSIYSVFGFYAQVDSVGIGQVGSQSPDINASMEPLWLDVYANHESGFIFMENKGNTKESTTCKDESCDINDDLLGTYGWGFVPGLVNIVNSGFSQPCGSDCGTFYSYNAQIYGLDSGAIDFSSIGNQKAEINVQQVMFYGDTSVPDAMSISLPWRAAGAAISLTSNGGNGAVMADIGMGGGDGGEVKLTLQDYRFYVAPHEPLATSDSRDYGVFTALNAVSKGGYYGFASVLSDRYGLTAYDEESDVKGLNGNGADVVVALSGVRIISCGGTKTNYCNASDSTYSTSNIIGLNAASLGGATQASVVNTDDSTIGFAPGVGGNVSVTLSDSSVVNLPFNNSVGVVATSTGDQTLLAPGTRDIYGLPDGQASKVSVELLTGSQVLVGQKGLQGTDANAGDTNVAVLANSSGSWGRELFTGADLAHSVPGVVGDVEVTNLGDITAYGPNAVGVLAQSVGGVSISSPSASASSSDTSPANPVGDSQSSDINIKATGYPGSDGGSVTYKSTYTHSDGTTSTGGSITVEGDGASGLLLQSIGGGGGAGGDSTGLFVAVGGAGGRGGHGGALTASLASHSITSKGDFAKGVVGQSIGGGGGNGGYAKSFGFMWDVGIGGSGGGGGDGGEVTLSASDSTVSTSGQHAYGIAFQSIGGGGGTGGAAQSVAGGAGITVSVATGGSGGSGGAGGPLTVSVDDKSRVVTNGLDAHGILLQSISGGGGAGGSASGASYNVGQIPEVPAKISFTAAVGGLGGSSHDAGKLTVTNDGSVATSGAGSHGLVLQSIGGGGGHGADSTAASNSWGDLGTNPSLQFTASVGVGGDGGAAGSGGVIDLTSTGTISTAGHHSIGLLAHSIGGGGGTGGAGNAYSTSRWVGNNKGDKQADTTSVTMNLGAGGKGGAAGHGGEVDVTINRKNGLGFTTVGSGSSGIVIQSIGGGGGVAGDAGTQAINGGTVESNVQLGGRGGDGGDGGAVTVKFEGTIQTGAVTLLQYTDDDGSVKQSSPVTIGGSSHGIVAQSIGGGGGIGGNADPSTALVPTLTKDIVTWQYDPATFDPKKIDPKQIKSKIMNIKDGIVFWAKRVVENEDKWPKFDISYSANVSLGGAGGKGGNGSDVNLDITDQSDITTYGHHSYAIMAQSIGGGGGVAGTASANSLVSGDVKVNKLGQKITAGMSVNLGGSGGASGDGGNVYININNPLSSDFNAPNNPINGNYLRTGGYASHVVFAQSVGGGGGVGHEGSIIGITALPGVKNPGVSLGNANTGAIKAGDGGEVTVGKDRYITGWIESAGDASSLIFAQSVGGGGGTISMACSTNGGGGTSAIKQSACFTDATYESDTTNTTTFSAGAFINDLFQKDIQVNSAGGSGGDVIVNLGDSHLQTTGDRSIAIVAQSIGGGGGYISADARNVGHISPDTTVDTSLAAQGASVTVSIDGSQGGSNGASITTSGRGAWGIFAQSVGGSGGLFGDTALDIVSIPQSPDSSSDVYGSVASGQVSVSLKNASIKTSGVNAHGIVVQSWASNGSSGGVFAGSGGNQDATLVLGSKQDTQNASASDMATVTIDKLSSVRAVGNGSIGLLVQSGQASVDIAGLVYGGATYNNAAANNRSVQGVAIMIAAGDRPESSNTLHVHATGNITTDGDVQSGYAIMTTGAQTNVTNDGSITGSVDLGPNPGTFTNNGTLNKGKVYKVGNNSLHNYGTINIGNEDSVSTTNLEGRIVQYDSGRTLVTFDVLGDQSNDRLIVDGTAVLGGSFETRAKSLLPGDYAFLTATDLTVTANAADRLLYAWDATVTDSNVTVTPTRTFRAEGLSLSPTSQNLVSYLERAWDNADAHHAPLFGYKHELEAVEDYNSLLETLGGQALNAQPLQMRMSVLSNLGDSMACPVVTPNGLSLGEDRCVWAKLTGEVSDLSSSDNNLGYKSTGGGLRVGTQQTLGQGWTVGAAAGYALNDLTATDFSSNGQVFDLSLSAKRDVGQWSFGGSLGYAYGWFDNNRQLSAPDAGIASGFNRQYNSNSSLSIYSAKLRAAYTFEQDAHYIRPYVDFDVAYSQAPGFSESGQENLALQTQSTSQWNVGISPMVEYGADFVTENKTRMMFFVSAGATFLPNNQQTTPTSFVGAQAANGTFDVITDGPNVLGRLNLGMQVYEQEGYEVRAQYGLQAGEDYWSQSVSINAVFRF